VERSATYGWNSKNTIKSRRDGIIWAKSFFEVLFRLKGVIFITAGKRQRSLRQCTAPKLLPERQDLYRKSTAFQAEVVVLSFLRRSTTCGYENPALQAASASNLFCKIIAPQKKVLAVRYGSRYANVTADNSCA
jgi:hypothetical protein